MNRPHLPLALVALASVAAASAVHGQVPGADGELRVWSAASVGPVVGEMGRVWEEEGHGAVRLAVDATSRLATQLAEGAPADVLVTADRRWMDWALERELVRASTVRVLAGNRLVLVRPAGSSRPLPVPPAPGTPSPASFQDLLRDSDAMDRIGIAGESVPAGRYAREALRAGDLWETVESRLVVGGNVRTVVEWVARGELPMGLVYASDAVDDARLEILAAVPGSLHTPVEILGAAVAGGDVSRGEAFLDLLVSERGQAAFREHGFPTEGMGSVVPSPEGPPLDGPAQAAGGNAPAGEGASVSPSPASAVRISLVVALAATLLATIPAIGLGWLLARRSFPGRTLLGSVLLAPLVIPPVVTGFLLLSLLGREGLLGSTLALAGMEIPFTLAAAVVAAMVVGFPLYVVSVRNAFETVDRRMEQVSSTLGARPWRTFRKVTLPLALPGIAAGAVLTFARALGEFGATIVLAGNIEGETRTIALAVYTLLESPGSQGEVWILVGASVAFSVVALAGYEFLSRRQRRRLQGGADG